MPMNEVMRRLGAGTLLSSARSSRQAAEFVSKAQFIAEMRPFVGYTFAGLVDDVRAAEFGDAIILTYREKEIRDYGVQRTENSYIDTETYIRLDSKWQLILFTENALPVEPAIDQTQSANI